MRTGKNHKSEAVNITSSTWYPRYSACYPGEKMRRTRKPGLPGIIVVFILFISMLSFSLPRTSGYDDRNSFGQDTEEYVLDVPWRIGKGKTIPVLLIIHDADQARGKSILLRSIKITISDEDDLPLSEQELNATQLGGSTLNNTLRLTDEYWAKEVIFKPSDFTGSGPDYVGMTTVEAVFSLFAGEETREKDMEISNDKLTRFSKWYLGESHAYSNYTDTRSDFGAPVGAMARAGNSIGLDWLAVTDNSTSITEAGYNERSQNMAAENAILSKPLLIPAEEVVCQHENGGTPGNEYGKLLVYGTDYMESTNEPVGNRMTTGEVISVAAEADGASYVTDVFTNTLTFAPWDSFPDNLTGLEIWKGDSPYLGENKRMLDRWVALLLEGKRLYALAGSGAHGEFDRLGRVRTLSFMPDGLEEENVIKALRWGHTVLTNGPLGIFTCENENGSEFVIGENSEPVLEGQEILLKPQFSCDPMFGEIETATLHLGVIGGNETEFEIPTDEEEVDITPHLPPNRDVYIRLSIESSDGVKSYHALSNPMWIKCTNMAPLANAGENRTVYLGEEVHFEGKGTDPDGKVERYEWDFDGDGTYDWSSKTTGDTDFEYEELGIYTAFFRVTDERGLSTVDNCTVEVIERPPNTPPRVDAGVDVTVEEGMTITLTAKVEDDENNVVKYEWSEDGAVLSSSLILKKIFTAGIHILTFTATDAEDAMGSDTVTVTVTEIPNVLPVAILTVSPDTAFIDRSIDFEGSDSSDEDGQILRYNFTFGDGKFSGWQEQSSKGHGYETAGKFTAFLQVMDDRGGISTSEEIEIIIRARPTDTDEEDVKKGFFEKVKDYVSKNKILVGAVGAAVIVFIITIIVILILVKRKGHQELVFKKVGVREIGDDGEGAKEEVETLGNSTITSEDETTPVDNDLSEVIMDEAEIVEAVPVDTVEEANVVEVTAEEIIEVAEEVVEVAPEP